MILEQYKFSLDGERLSYPRTLAGNDDSVSRAEIPINMTMYCSKDNTIGNFTTFHI